MCFFASYFIFLPIPPCIIFASSANIAIFFPESRSDFCKSVFRWNVEILPFVFAAADGQNFAGENAARIFIKKRWLDKKCEFAKMSEL